VRRAEARAIPPLDHCDAGEVLSFWIRPTATPGIIAEKNRKMKALFLERPGVLQLRDAFLPEPDAGEVRLRVTHCAICRTDSKMWQQGHRDLLLPRVLGHEICAFREETGERFIIWPGKSCGACLQCRHGAENLCLHMRIIGFHRDGGFAEAIIVPQSSLIPIPDNVPGELACLAEPLACSLNALETAQLSAGKKVLIYGGGPVGLMMALVAQDLGVEPLVLENNPLRIQQTQAFRTRLGLKAVPQYGGPGLDLVVNACSSLDAFREGLSQLGSGGSFCLFSGFPNQGAVPASLLNEVHYRQLKVVGAYGCTRRHLASSLRIIQAYGEALSLLIEQCITLEAVPFAIPKILLGQVLKIVVDFQEGRFVPS
jgi:L-iditol 2-dehydrogenase